MKPSSLEEKLFQAALSARNYSYAPYSHWTVGAALLTEDNEIFTGCNIENGAYSPSCCAERVAIFKAVSEGKMKFSAIAVAGGKEGEEPEDFCPPCGVCRQVLSEFCGDDFPVWLVKKDGAHRFGTLGDYLPYRFSLSEKEDDLCENV